MQLGWAQLYCGTNFAVATHGVQGYQMLGLVVVHEVKAVESLNAPAAAAVADGMCVGSCGSSRLQLHMCAVLCRGPAASRAYCASNVGNAFCGGGKQLFWTAASVCCAAPRRFGCTQIQLVKLLVNNNAMRNSVYLFVCVHRWVITAGCLLSAGSRQHCSS